MWSLSIYLEQPFTADLFLWLKEWEQAAGAARRAGREEPLMRKVPRPTLLDDVASLDERELPGGGSAPWRGRSRRPVTPREGAGRAKSPPGGAAGGPFSWTAGGDDSQ